MRRLPPVGSAKCPCCGQATEHGIRWSLEARARWERGAADLVDPALDAGAVKNETADVFADGKAKDHGRDADHEDGHG